MQKTLIATVFVFLFYLSDATAQQRRHGRDGQQARTQQDSTRGPGGRFRQMEPVTAAELPATVAPFVKQTYPNADMKRIAKSKEGRFYVVLAETDKPRRLLIVDSKGEIVENREMPIRNGRGAGRRPNRS
ncbi:hypothetical protein [Spirosoma sordidisoli]|uniref:PepSY domain-containing protein n=1 Tax=Spirosoma sordidisoli TaxID=2502893 RepID=A0A4V1RWJ7_9BACT|nr:hypothetical protein [Spirosoma sordidisoli]RYC70508.1 hypothetical protein EQG79_11715 [Spirosoma sordidisoli]